MATFNIAGQERLDFLRTNFSGRVVEIQFSGAGSEITSVFPKVKFMRDVEDGIIKMYPSKVIGNTKAWVIHDSAEVIVKTPATEGGKYTFTVKDFGQEDKFFIKVI